MSLEIGAVGWGRRDTNRFVDVLWRVYEDDSAWVPPLRRLARQQVRRKSTPFLRYGQAQLFLAERDGTPVGRISAHLNPLHDWQHGESAGFFGFYECADDAEASAGLLAAAEEWLRARGATFARGPVSFTMNQEVGCLVEGFDTPPVVAMPHGRPSYDGMIRSSGYRGVKDLYAYSYPVTTLQKRRRTWYDRIRAMPNVRVRPFDGAALRRDVRIAVEIFNNAWEGSWGFVPVTVSEADHLAETVRPFIDLGLTAIVEVDGEPAAMVLAIPDLNEHIGDLNGRLLPTGWAKLLWRMHAPFGRRGFENARVALLGIKKAYRRRELAGLALMLTAEVHMRGRELGYRWAELGWVLEDNHLLTSTLTRMQARRYKTYRVYEKSLGRVG